ncbi:hypothetical protein BJX99DRAFT_232363 [Aspergillus californicus]
MLEMNCLDAARYLADFSTPHVVCSDIGCQRLAAASRSCCSFEVFDIKDRTLDAAAEILKHHEISQLCAMSLSGLIDIPTINAGEGEETHSEYLIGYMRSRRYLSTLLSFSVVTVIRLAMLLLVGVWTDMVRMDNGCLESQEWRLFFVCI